MIIKYKNPGLKDRVKMSLPAFTLMELLVGMVLTALLLSLAFAGFHFVQLQFSQYQRVQEEGLALQRLHTLLLQENYRSRYLLFDHSGHLQFIETPDRQSLFHFERDRIIWIRQNGDIAYRDTFSFLGQIHEFIQPKSQSDLIEWISFSITAFGKQERLSISKEYSALDLMKFELNEYRSEDLSFQANGK